MRAFPPMMAKPMQAIHLSQDAGLRDLLRDSPELR
jgi:hypothetical protein